MDLEKDIVPKIGFDPHSQPFGHEQPRFRRVVEEIFDESVVSDRFSDSQREVFELRFLKDKSYGEIAAELKKDAQDVEKIRQRGVDNLLEIFLNCKIDLQSIFEEKDLVKKLKDGHQEILNSFNRWIKQGIFTEHEVEITKHYSKIFNGLGDKDSLVEHIMASGISDRAKLREGDDIKEVREIVRKTSRFFYAKHFPNF